MANHSGVLLIIIGEPFSEEHKDSILQTVENGLQCWDKEASGCDLNKELATFLTSETVPEDGQNDQITFDKTLDALKVELVIHPNASSVESRIQNLLQSPAPYRHLVYAGHYMQGTGQWLLQDDVFGFRRFAKLCQIADANVKESKDSHFVISGKIEGDWSETAFKTLNISKNFQLKINPAPSLDNPEGFDQFLDFVSSNIKVQQLKEVLPSSEIVGNIRFSRPTLYIFPGSEGDSALLGISGFNILVNGGFSKRACFWDIARHLDKIDAVLMTHLGADNLFGMRSVLEKKLQENMHPEIGYVFMNASDTKPTESKSSLGISLVNEGCQLVDQLKQIGQAPNPCIGVMDKQVLQPITLYQKLGHGTLDMYILNPVQDCKELKDFFLQWGKKVKNFTSPKIGKGGKDAPSFPLPNLVSVSALVVWKPFNTAEKPTRILFPGNTPQAHLFEGLDKLKKNEIFQQEDCTKKAAAKSTKKPATTTAARPVNGKPPTKATSQTKPEATKKETVKSAAPAASKTKKTTSAPVAMKKKTSASNPAPKTSTPIDGKNSSDLPKLTSAINGAGEPILNITKKVEQEDNTKIEQSKIEEQLVQPDIIPAQPDQLPEPKTENNVPEEAADIALVKMESEQTCEDKKEELLEVAQEIAPVSTEPALGSDEPETVKEKTLMSTEPTLSSDQPENLCEPAVNSEQEDNLHEPASSEPAMNSEPAISSHSAPVSDEQENLPESAMSSDRALLSDEPENLPEPTMSSEPALLIDDFESKTLPEPAICSEPALLSDEPENLPEPAMSLEPALLSDEPENKPEPAISSEPALFADDFESKTLPESAICLEPALVDQTDDPMNAELAVKSEDLPEIAQSEVPLNTATDLESENGFPEKQAEVDNCDPVPEFTPEASPCQELSPFEDNKADFEPPSPAGLEDENRIDEVIDQLQQDHYDLEQETMKLQELDHQQGGILGDELVDKENQPHELAEPISPDEIKLTDTNGDDNELFGGATPEGLPEPDLIATLQQQDTDTPAQTGGQCVDMLSGEQHETNVNGQNGLHEPFTNGFGTDAPLQVKSDISIPEPSEETPESPSSLNANAEEFDPLKTWGQPMGLPAPPTDTAASSADAKAKKAGPKPTPGRAKVPAKTSQTSTRGVASRPSTAGSTTGRTNATASSKSTASAAKSTSSASRTSTASKKSETTVTGARKGSAPTSRPSVGVGKKSGSSTPTKRGSAASVQAKLTPVTPFYVDLSYVPCHGNAKYVDRDFFRRVRSRYYVISSLSIDTSLLDNLLEAKNTWDNANAEVTVIPTYDTQSLHHWMALHREDLAAQKIEIAPSASRCTIQLQDHETSCSAYRLEF